MARFDETRLQEGVPITMVDAIRTALKGSPLDIRCPRCRCYNCYTIDEYLLSSPRILLVQLNRVALDGHKINEPIQIEETLDLPRELFSDPTLDEESLAMGYHDESAEAVQNPRAKYTLCAVVHNIGDTSQGGHYYAHVKKDSVWRVVDNDFVDVQSLDSINTDVNRRSAYVFAYRREDTEDQVDDTDMSPGSDFEDILDPYDIEERAQQGPNLIAYRYGGEEGPQPMDEPILGYNEEEVEQRAMDNLTAAEVMAELRRESQEYPQPMDEPTPGFYEDLEKDLKRRAMNDLTAADYEELRGKPQEEPQSTVQSVAYYYREIPEELQDTYEQQGKLERIRTVADSDYDEFGEEPQDEPQDEEEEEEKEQTPLKSPPTQDHQLQKARIEIHCKQPVIETILDKIITLPQEATLPKHSLIMPIDIQVTIFPPSSSSSSSSPSLSPAAIEEANSIILAAKQQKITLKRTTPHAHTGKGAKKANKRNNVKKKSKRVNRFTRSQSQSPTPTSSANTSVDSETGFHRRQTRSMTRSSGIPLAKPLFSIAA